jgi:hypothetical protein
MSRIIPIVLLGVAGLEPSWVSGQIQANDLSRLIPAETESIIGVEVSRLRTTPRWPLLLDIAQQWKRFQDPVSTTGFDPSLHLDELAMLTVGEYAGGELVVLRGRFDASRIAQFDPANPEGHETRYRGIRVCAPLQASDGYLQWTASIADMVVIGPADLVRVAIDTYLGTEPRRAWFDVGLARVRSRSDVWVVARHRVSVGVEEGDGLGLEWSGGVRLDAKPSAEVEIVARSPREAQAYANLLQAALANDWRVKTSRVVAIAAASMRISIDQRIVRVSAEMDWEPLLVMAAGMRF